MINKKYYCNTSDKNILNKSRQNKAKLHTQLSSGVLNKYYNVDIPVGEINDVINKHIYDYQKIFHNFGCWCIIQN